jgi:hypothetical protein
MTPFLIPRRLKLPGVPLHVTQRDINKGVIFLEADDRYYHRVVHVSGFPIAWGSY